MLMCIFAVNEMKIVLKIKRTLTIEEVRRSFVHRYSSYIPLMVVSICTGFSMSVCGETRQCVFCFMTSVIFNWCSAPRRLRVFEFWKNFGFNYE